MGSSFSEAVAQRRKRLNLTYQEIEAAGGPSSPTMLSIEQGRKRSIRESTFAKLDIALQWPAGTARREYADDTASSTPTFTRDRDRLADLQTAYRQLLDNDAPPEALAAAGEVLAYALIPSLLIRLQQLSVEDLYELDSDELLELNEILTAGSPTAPDTSSTPSDTLPTPSRTIARLPDGRTLSLKALRQERGLSQEAVAAAVTEARRKNQPGARAASVSTISGIESGHRGAGRQLTRDLEDAFGLRRGAVTKQW